jgi:hypothetical protein
MKGLLLRLSAVDADAEAAVRVIAYFDELVARRARLSDLVRATAALAECVAGLQPDGTTPPLRFSPEGDRAGDAVAEPTSADLGRDAGGRVWLERPGSSCCWVSRPPPKTGLGRSCCSGSTPPGRCAWWWSVPTRERPGRGRRRFAGAGRAIAAVARGGRRRGRRGAVAATRRFGDSTRYGPLWMNG